MKLTLKDKLKTLRIENKFNQNLAIRHYKVGYMEELTILEKERINYVNKLDSKCDDEFPLNSSPKNYISWIIRKTAPFLEVGTEFIVIYNYRVAYLVINDIENFFKSYFNEENSWSFDMINREKRKYISIFPGEYSLEYFELNI